MRIRNAATLAGHGNIAGRETLLQILEAGLQAADPYANTRKLVRVEGNQLIVGGKEFEPAGTPVSRTDVFDLNKVRRIIVIGACKGVQHVAKALEDVLGDRLTGGHVIGKHGDEIILNKIGVTLGAHPAPDQCCAEGCLKIKEAIQGLTADDIVFTITGNGVSSLMTLPVPGVTVDEVRQLTYLMQIDRGAPTEDLNCIRNHLDQMKGGRIGKMLRPATVIDIMAVGPGNYDRLIHHGYVFPTLPDATTFDEAVRNLKKWNAWDYVAPSIRAHLTKADPAADTIHYDQFNGAEFRIYGIMPSGSDMMAAAQAKARELGYKPYMLAAWMQAEAREAGQVIANIASTIERLGQPVEPPCALFTGGELLVTVGRETGIGGRNQEFALAAARKIAGSRRIVIGAVDTDGTDGPGTQFADGQPGIPPLGGGIVDGETMREAAERGVDVETELRRHNTSPALWALDSGVWLSQNISVCDFGVVLVMG